MSAAKELQTYNFATHQSKQQKSPATVASAATIAPDSLITYVSGTVQVETITPPLDGQHMLILVFTNAAPGQFLTTGNILNAVTPTQDLPTFLFYDPARAKYIACASNLT